MAPVAPVAAVPVRRSPFEGLQPLTRRLIRASDTTLGWRELVACFVLMALVVTAAFPSVVFGDNTLVAGITQGMLPTGPYGYPRDLVPSIAQDGLAASLVETWHYLVAHVYLLHGHLPLWNPYLAAGRPLAANYSSGAFFLPEVLFSTLPYTAWDSYYLLRLVATGLFTYLFLRTLRLSRVSCLVGALAYTFSGALIWNVNGVWADGPMLLPLLLWTLERLATARTRVLRWLVVSSLVIWQMILSGFAEIALLCLAFSGLYYLARVVDLRYGGGLPWRGFVAKMAHYAIAGLSGIALAAPLLFIFVELLHNSYPGRSSMLVARLASPPVDIFRIFLPFFFGPLSSLWHATLSTGYCGAVAPLLALLAVEVRKHREHAAVALFFAIMLVLALSVSYQTPVNSVASSLPVTRLILLSRYSSALWSFSLAALAALGVHYLPQTRQRTKIAVVLLYVAFLGGLAIVSLSTWSSALHTMSAAEKTTMQPFVQDSLKAAASFVAAAALLIFLSMRFPRAAQGGIAVLLAIELVSFVPRTLPMRYDAFTVPPYARYLQQQPGPFRVFPLDFIAATSTLAPLQIEDVRDFDALYVGNYQYLILHGFDPSAFAGWAGAFSGDQVFRPPTVPTEAETITTHRRILDLLGVKYILTQITSLGDSVPTAVSAHAPQDLVIGPSLITGTTLGQQIHAERADLRGILLSFSRTGPVPPGTVRLHLRTSLTGASDLRTATLPTSSIDTTGLTTFAFPPIPDSAGKSYYISLDSVGPPSGLSLWYAKYIPVHPVVGAYTNNVAQPMSMIYALDYGMSSRSPFTLVYSHDISIYRNEAAFPRAFVVHRIQSGVSDAEAAAELGSPSFDPARTLLLADRQDTSALQGVPATDASTVSVAHVGASEVTLTANLEHPGYVALQDTYYPGWHAYLDGADVPILRSDVMFRAVAVPKGRHTIRFVYAPRSFQLGVAVMLLPVLLLAGWGAWRWRTRPGIDPDRPVVS